MLCPEKNLWRSTLQLLMSYFLTGLLVPMQKRPTKRSSHSCLRAYYFILLLRCNAQACPDFFPSSVSFGSFGSPHSLQSRADIYMYIYLLQYIKLESVVMDGRRWSVNFVIITINMPLPLIFFSSRLIHDFSSRNSTV